MQQSVQNTKMIVTTKKNQLSFKQFKRQDYECANKTKKKCMLVDKCMASKDFEIYFQQKVQSLIQHKYNVKHTRVVPDYLMSALQSNEVVFIREFFENYE